MKTWIVDTGPLVAYLDASDPRHAEVTSALDAFAGQLVTTSAVITEAMHFVSAASEGPTLLADLVMTSGAIVYDYTQPPGLRQAARLMHKYADTPMDFADATLVLLAAELAVFDVLTLDVRGFRTYRTDRKKSFRLVV